jgi:hypothetical protein
MQLTVPDGYFCDSHMVYGDLGTGAVMARMYDCVFPDLSTSDDKHLVNLEQDIRLMLGCLQKDERMQLVTYTSNEYGTDLDTYERQSPDPAFLPVSASVRSELVNRFRHRISAETLIKIETRLVLSSKLPKFIKEDGRRVKGFVETFNVVERSFQAREQFFNMLLAGYGGSVKGLDNQGHYEEMLRFWSPSQSRIRGRDVTSDSKESVFAEYKNKATTTDALTDWLRPIDDLCRFSNISSRREPDHGFYLDGYYHGVLVAKSMPRMTWAKTMAPFTELCIPNLRIVLNMEPGDIEAEIRHEEDRYQKLYSNVIDPKHPSLQSEVGLDQHRERMRGLMSNKLIPFKAQLIVIAAERSPDKLDATMQAVRVALGKTGCEPYEPALSTSTLSFFNCATPGCGPWTGYRDYLHKMDDAINCGHMWAATSTPTGDLCNADWICDGEQNNLIGGRLFSGDSPNHHLVMAMTGYGKDVLTQTIVLQTAPMFKFIVVIDDGLSWATTCHKLDPSCRPIMVQANGKQTFNPFQTDGPLTSEHLSNATALVHLLVGKHADQDKDKLRHAIIAETISEMYGVAFRKWRARNPIAYYDLCPDLDESEQSEIYRQSIAFARFTPEMFPTLSDLQDELHSASLQKGPHQEHCAALAALLRPWLRDGVYGSIVDGQGNIDLGSVDVSESDPLKVVHFELSKITNRELREVVGFLITQNIKQHIMGMPRHLKKLCVFNELTSFLQIPNGPDIVTEYYQVMRKYNTCVTSIFQQYSTLLAGHEKVAKAIIGNTSVLLLLGNHNREDLATLGDYLPEPLPEVIVQKISRIPKPSDLPAETRYGGFVMVNLNGDQPRYTVGKNFISYEVEAITSSSADTHEQKMNDLQNEQS